VRYESWFRKWQNKNWKPINTQKTVEYKKRTSRKPIRVGDKSKKNKTMRTLLRVTCEVAASNKAIIDGTLAKVMKSTMEKIQPEASYFATNEGCRSGFMVFDLKDPSDIPSIAEPFFLSMNAKVEFSPVMNAEEMQKGLEKFGKSQGS